MKHTFLSITSLVDKLSRQIFHIFLSVAIGYLLGLLIWMVRFNDNFSTYFSQRSLVCAGCHNFGVYIVIFILLSFAGYVFLTIGKKEILKRQLFFIAILTFGIFSRLFSQWSYFIQISIAALICSFYAFDISRYICKWWKCHSLSQKKEKMLLIAMVIGTTTVYVLYSLIKLYHFQYPAKDLAIFNQAVWNYSRFQAPASTIREFSNLLGDHFHPILIFLVPFYWMWKNPGTLLIIQGIVLSLGGIPIYLIAKEKLKNQAASFLFTFCFLFFIGFQNAVDFGFYPETMISAFFAFAFLFFLRKRKIFFWIFILLALMCKENVALYVFFFGIWMIYQKEKIWGLSMMFVGVMWYFLTVNFLIPYFAVGQYQYLVFGQLGSSPVDAIKTILSNPLFALNTFFNPPLKIETMLYLFTSVGFLSFLSPVTMILLLPMLGERFLLDRSISWGIYFHYSSTIGAPLFIAAIYGISEMYVKINNKIKRIPSDIFCWLGLYCCTILLLLSMNNVIFRNLTTTIFYSDAPKNKTAREIMRMIPENASVSAINSLAPYLSQRDQIYRYPETMNNKVEYIIFSYYHDAWPFSSSELRKEAERIINEKNYIVVIEKNEVVLFKKSK